MDVDGCRWMDPKVKGREEGGPSGTIGAIRLLLLLLRDFVNCHQSSGFSWIYGSLLYSMMPHTQI